MTTHKIHPSETQIHMHVVKLLEAYARHDIEFHHVPNGEERHPKTAKRLKLMGVQRGVADLMFMIDGQSIALELKTDIGTQSRDQADWQERFERAGGKYFHARGMDQILATLKTINALQPNINLTPTAAFDGRRVRTRPWHSPKEGVGAATNSTLSENVS